MFRLVENIVGNRYDKKKKTINWRKKTFVCSVTYLDFVDETILETYNIILDQIYYYRLLFWSKRCETRVRQQRRWRRRRRLGYGSKRRPRELPSRWRIFKLLAAHARSSSESRHSVGRGSMTNCLRRITVHAAVGGRKIVAGPRRRRGVRLTVHGRWINKNNNIVMYIILFSLLLSLRVFVTVSNRDNYFWRIYCLFVVIIYYIIIYNRYNYYTTAGIQVQDERSSRTSWYRLIDWDGLKPYWFNYCLKLGNLSFSCR